MSEGPKYSAFVTPAGEAVFPWLTKADTEHDKNGVYHVDLSVPFEEAQPLVAKLEKTLNDFIATLPLGKQKAFVKRPVYMEELTRPDYPEGANAAERKAIRDNWVGEPTGNLLFRCKLKAQFTGSEGETITQAPVVVMADTGEKIDVPVYSGSIVRVKGQIVPYTNTATGQAGISLRMKAVQVLELVSGGGGDGFWTDFDKDD
jgi:hypothetical protein